MRSFASCHSPRNHGWSSSLLSTSAALLFIVLTPAGRTLAADCNANTFEDAQELAADTEWTEKAIKDHDSQIEGGALRSPVVAIAPYRFVVNVDGFDLELPYSRSHPLDVFNAQIDRVIVTVHGSGRDATNYYARVQSAANEVGAAVSTLILAPQFLEEEDIDFFGLGSEFLFWNGGWRQGNTSSSTTANPRPAVVRSFTVVELMLEQIASSGLFPSVAQVVVTGHSAGGQYTNRFAAGNQVEDQVLIPTGIDVRYVIANPGSYVYFNEERRVAGTLDAFAIPSAVEQAACPTFDDYKYGLNALNSYMAAVGVHNIRSQYHRREVIHLVGALDNVVDPGETDCAVLMQGDHRLERTTIYFNYLQHYFGPTILGQQRMGVVPGVGHSSNGMFHSPLGKRHLFDYDTGVATVLRVDEQALAGGDGLTWATAFDDLQEAIVEAAVSGGDVVEIWVADGIHRPDQGTGDRRQSFQLLNGVGIYGGFAGINSLLYPGGETQRLQRDPAANPTILSGDLNGDDESGGDQSDNSYLVVSTEFSDATAILDGFIITGGTGSDLALKVDAQALAGGDGSTWSTAFDNLSDALNFAADSWGHVAEIWVANGNYRPSDSGDRWESFPLQDGLEIYGGFAGIDSVQFPGGENARGQRDHIANQADLSGDLNGDDAIGNIGDNSFHVVSGNGAGPTAILDGFSIVAGNADGPAPNDAGGGMRNAGSSPTLRSLRFEDNNAIWGGAIENIGSSAPTLIDCTFIGNHANQDGGAISNNGSDPTVLRCAFIGNVAGDDGGAIRSLDSEPTLTFCLFNGNSAADNAGAIYDITSTRMPKPALVNCVFGYNIAPDRGGGIANFGNSIPTLSNCILWGNTAGVSGAQISGAAVVTFSCIQDGWTGLGNIVASPLFVDSDGPDNIPGTVDDDLRLSAGSPAIDAGSNGAVPPGITTDLGGSPRFVDDPNTVDTGFGTSPIVDMGAYEFQTGDCDADGDVDLIDLAALEACLLGPEQGLGAGCGCFDLDPDADVDLRDFAVFQLNLTGPEYQPGDCDGDGDVDLVDLAALEACLDGPDGGLDAGCGCFDLDPDADVDLRDFARFQLNFSS